VDTATLFSRYQDLQRYVGWEAADVERIHAVAFQIAPCFPRLIDDFYDEIERHPEALQAITGGSEQIERLKGSLLNWLKELFQGNYDEDYVARRWQVGLRHVQIELNQVYVNAAMARLRSGILDQHTRICEGSIEQLMLTRRSINRLIDLDLAIIQDAYQTEFLRRQRVAERFATIGQVAGGIAHELRNPLNVIKTSVYFVRTARHIGPETRAGHLERIDRQASIADRVITALHDFARLPLPRLQPVPVRDFLLEVVRDHPPPASIQAQVDGPADLPPAFADADQMKIVLGNLARNAYDAMPEGGSLLLSARVAGKYIEIRVSDSGIGMSAEGLRRMMEPFHSTKPRGLGLGLAIARAILDHHHARFSASSQEGQGTTFLIQLPLYSEELTLSPET
jgi:signal transduction histidine kinase